MAPWIPLTLPIMVYGDASTAKQALFFRCSSISTALSFIQAAAHVATPRILSESILNQLLLHSKCSSNEYASAKRCDKPSDFFKLNFDKPLLMWWQDHGLPPDVYYANMGYTDPLPFWFTSLSILKLTRNYTLHFSSKANSYSVMLSLTITHMVSLIHFFRVSNSLVLRPFCRVTRRVEELSTTFSLPFRKVSSHSHDGERRQKASYSSENGEELEMLNFYMSTSAKYLLIAAFLASRNPATLDASMFDSTSSH
ncbi:Origin of replication complex subunit 5 [Raphanus sativus]|nr:Origin of replication complex subunit 5 [Raphanus sativus]